MFNPIDNVVDFNDASSTLEQVGVVASPIFQSTIKPAAFFEGILLGGFLVAVLLTSLIWAVGQMFLWRKESGATGWVPFASRHGGVDKWSMPDTYGVRLYEHRHGKILDR